MIRTRLHEYRFALQHLKPYRILDVGCCESHFCLLLAECWLEVIGVDVQRCYPQYEFKPYNTNYGSFKFICKDIRLLDLPDNYFDTVINVSTIEHIGLVAYDQKLIDKDGDIKAMKNIRRMLKPNGVLIFTCPYGKGGKSWLRVYNDERLKMLLEGFRIEIEEYRLYPDWKLISKDVAKDVYLSPDDSRNEIVNLCIKAVKVG
jgi:SAM-dependent methyltransferase